MQSNEMQDQVDDDGDQAMDLGAEEAAASGIARQQQAFVGDHDAVSIQDQNPGEAVPEGQGQEEAGQIQEWLAYILNNIEQQAGTLMQLTEDERRQALDIKTACHEASDLKEIPDMRYAQLALIDGEDVESAVERVRHLQLWRDEYNFLDTFEEGVEVMQAFFKQQPGTVLSIAYNAIDGNFVYIFDQVPFDINATIRTDKDWRTFSAFAYYLFQAMSPDFFAVRQGCVFIGECEGYNMGWERANIECIRRIMDECFHAYPIQIRELKFFHTNSVANMAFTMLKPFFPSYLRDRINLGCQFEGRLDTYYSVPTREEAEARTLSEVESYLRRRYANERDFSL